MLQCPSGPQPRSCRRDCASFVRLIHVNLERLPSNTVPKYKEAQRAAELALYEHMGKG